MVAATAKGQFMTWYQHFGGSQFLGELQSSALPYNLQSQICGKQVQGWGPQRNDLHESLQQYCGSKRPKFRTTESLHSF